MLCAASTDAIEAFIRAAERRLVVLAPGVPIAIAELLAERWSVLGPKNVSITLDVDAEVCRLGYGDADSLSLLETAGMRVGGMLQRHAGIRIGVIISDDRMMIFSPVPQLVEAGPRSSKAPNAIMLDAVPTALEHVLGQVSTESPGRRLASIRQREPKLPL